jgi:hypothetical protein
MLKNFRKVCIWVGCISCSSFSNHIFWHFWLLSFANLFSCALTCSLFGCTCCRSFFETFMWCLHGRIVHQTIRRTVSQKLWACSRDHVSNLQCSGIAAIRCFRFQCEEDQQDRHAGSHWLCILSSKINYASDERDRCFYYRMLVLSDSRRIDHLPFEV